MDNIDASQSTEYTQRERRKKKNKEVQKFVSNNAFIGIKSKNYG